MGILDELARSPANNAASANSNTSGSANGTAQQDRKPSQIWLNVGVTLPGVGEDGTDLFVSLPVGLPLDDMKPIVIRGTNQNSINLKQVKNMLLDELQKLGAAMSPGQRQSVPQLSVEVYRVGQPDQTGTAENNPLIAGLVGALSGKR